ncbi:hypothetical protein IWQ56_002582, partial [Coemansia nantahalensis]
MERKDGAALLPLFDASVAQDSNSPPRVAHQAGGMFSPPHPQQPQQPQQFDEPLHAGLFGQLPVSSSVPASV